MLGNADTSKTEHYNKGMALYDHGLYAEAIVEFEKVLASTGIEDGPERKLASFYMCESYTNLGLTHLNMSMYSRAEEELLTALSLHPEYADLHFHLSMVYYRDGDYRKAEVQLRHAVGINPRFSKALIYLGIVRLLEGNSDGLTHISEAVDIQPAYGDHRYTRAMSMYDSGDTEQAISLLREIAEMDVEQIGFMLDKGLRLMKDENYVKAADVLEEAANLCPNYADVHHYLGICYMRQGMMEQAMARFDNALQINPLFVAARLNLAEVHRNEGRPNLAMDELKQTLRIEPGNTAAEVMLSKLSASHPGV